MTMNVEIKVSGIVAKISAEAMVDTGNGMATLWNYPSDIKDVMPMPFTRLTVFDLADVMLENGKSVYPTTADVEVTALVSHLAYGVMKARHVVITKVVVIE